MLYVIYLALLTGLNLNVSFFICCFAKTDDKFDKCNKAWYKGPAENKIKESQNYVTSIEFVDTDATQEES